MAFFSNLNSGSPYLYLAQQMSSDVGWCAYVLPKGASAGSQIEIAESFNDLPGAYLFSFAKPLITGEALVQRVWTYIGQAISPNRAILWLSEPNAQGDFQFIALGFSNNTARVDPKGKVFSVTNALTGTVSDTLVLNIPGNCEVSLDLSTAAIQIEGDTSSSPPITFNTIDGIAATEISPNQLKIFFSGPGRGCIGFDLYIREGTDFNILDFGLKYFIPNQQDGVRIQRYPILRPDEPTQDQRVGFRVWIDLTHVENQDSGLRTFLAFTGKNKNGSSTLLPSAFATVFGHAINLTPLAQLGAISELPGADSALMVFQTNPRQGQNRYLAPAGKFAMTLADGSQQGQLLCSLSGTESLSFSSGDQLQFVPRRSAYAPIFPFPLASPVGPPIDPKAPLMTSELMTSWVTVVKATGSVSNPAYFAQPKGSSLYGRDDLISNKFPELFGHRDPAFVLPDQPGFAFPLAPYSAVKIKGDGTTFSREQIEAFELQVVGPTRRKIIGDAKPSMRASAAALLSARSLVGGEENITTPSGVIATLAPAVQTETWSKILLGQIQNGILQQIAFNNPDARLVQAFQTNQLFLVAANSCHLGKLSSSGQAPLCPSDASQGTFQNQVEIGGWKLAAEVGQNSQYGHYRDVVIFKGRKGKLYDPPPPADGADPTDDTVSLVANPFKWTQRGDFSSPAVSYEGQTQPQLPDDSQQIILSQWLQDYFRDVRELAADPQQQQYFQKLDSIARDENWTGFLILKMTIEDVPEELAGITAGITKPRAFNAHHFGIEIGQVMNKPGEPIALNNSSSMFGLIYYADPAFVAPRLEETPQPVPPPVGVDYDFRLLMLNVLFENTAVKSFQSYAQVTLNNLFGMPVLRMGDGGNMFNTIVLQGSLQNNNGKPVYSLGSTSDNTFYFDNNIIQKIELTSAQMSTRNPGKQATDPRVITWFGFTGFLDFTIVQSTQSLCDGAQDAANEMPENFDIFSFGSDAGQDQLRRGLSFSNLGIQMSFPPSAPTQRKFSFSAGELSFDLATSTPREGSLFSGFSLQIQSLQQGNEQSSPSQAGYATVITDAKLNGVDGGDWWGMRYQLNMGTPGNLAGNVGLTSYLLTGWAPDSSGDNGYKALVGLQLPGTGGGAKLISLQNVLRLSIGQMVLTLDRSNPLKPVKPFLLMLTEIALKFLGLLKIPPSGSTQFYLFGNPQNGGKPSGLGWYAMYKQEKKKAAAPSLLVAEMRKEKEGLMR